MCMGGLTDEEPACDPKLAGVGYEVRRSSPQLRPGRAERRWSTRPRYQSPTGRAESGRKEYGSPSVRRRTTHGEADAMIRRLLVAASLLPWGVGGAQQTDTTKAASATQEPTWSIPTRSLDFYAGIRSGGGATDVMLGAKFSRRIPSTRNMAAAGLAEVAFGDETEFLLGALFQI